VSTGGAFRHAEGSGQVLRNIIIVPYDPAWPALFRQIGGRLREALGDVALRIDHIGSTAVPGLAAKPIIDVQVSVAALEPTDPFRAQREGRMAPAA